MIARRLSTILMTAETTGGMWAYVVELARGLQRHGVSIALGTMGPLSPEQRAETKGLPNLHIFQSRFQLLRVPDPWDDVDRAGDWLLKLESQIRPDVIHLNGCLHGSLPWQTPVLMAGHSCALSWWDAVRGRPAPPEWREYRHRVQRGLHAAHLVVTPTRATLGALEHHYGPMKAARIIPHGRPSTGGVAAAKQPFIFGVGNLRDEGRNLRALSEAAPGLRWRIFLASSEGETGSPSQMQNVSYCGPLSRDAVAQWMSAAAIYCLPARYDPFGLSVLEAARWGCTLVLGDIPVLRELWEGAALFAPPDAPAELHRTLHILAADRPLRAAYARSAQARAARFTSERMAEEYLDAYQTLLMARPAFADQ